MRLGNRGAQCIKTTGGARLGRIMVNILTGPDSPSNISFHSLSMAGFVDIFGSLSNGFGTGSFFQSLIPQPADQTRVRMWAGLGLTVDTDEGGNIPTVNLWDGGGQFIGTSAATIGTIGAGEFHDYIIDPFFAGNNRPAEYMSVAAIESDDLCIAAISVTTPDSDQFVLVGDLPAYCGAQWYASNIVMGPHSYRPRCVWVTSQVSPTRKHQGFGVHLTDFAMNDPISNQYRSNRASCCHSTARFSMFTSIGPKDSIPFFSPPLQSAADGSDLDPGLYTNCTNVEHE